MNNGLLAIVADTRGITEGEALGIHLNGARPELRVGADPQRRIVCEPLSEFTLALREAGGIVAYLRRHRTLA